MKRIEVNEQETAEVKQNYGARVEQAKAELSERQRMIDESVIDVAIAKLNELAPNIREWRADVATWAKMGLVLSGLQNKFNKEIEAIGQEIKDKVIAANQDGLVSSDTDLVFWLSLTILEIQRHHGLDTNAYINPASLLFPATSSHEVLTKTSAEVKEALTKQ